MKKLEKLEFSETALYDDLIRSAKVAGLSRKAAGPMAKAIVEKVAKRVQKRSMMTIDDLNRYVAMEVEKFNKDLAYDYKNRGKII